MRKTTVKSHKPAIASANLYQINHKLKIFLKKNNSINYY